MRLFVAILPDATVRRALLDTQSKLKRQGVSANFTRADNLHLTLAFLGESDRAAAAVRAMERAAAAPFPMELRGLGRFGDLLWVGVRKDPALLSLVKSLRESLKEEGFSVEKEEFAPHITVGRRAVWREPPQVEASSAGMTVRRISLMCSKRVEGRLTYTEMAAAALH